MRGSAPWTDLEPLRGGRGEENPRAPASPELGLAGHCSGPVPSGPVVLTQPLHTSLFCPKHQCGPPLPHLLLLAWLQRCLGLGL